MIKLLLLVRVLGKPDLPSKTFWRALFYKYKRIHNLTLYFCPAFSSGNHAGSSFISEPVNVTVFEGDSVTFNCSSTMNEFFAVWIIDGWQYLWSEFENSETYTFNQLDNSLTINNSPRSLNGLSFQCVIDRQESQIGYLTVLYTDDNSTSTTLVSSELPTKIVMATSLSTILFTKSSTIITPGMVIMIVCACT